MADRHQKLSVHNLLDLAITLFKTIYLLFISWLSFIVPAVKKSVAGEIVLVTGAGSGIGRLISINFAKQGSTLVLWDINKEGNDETAEQIKQLGGKAHSYVVDVTKKEDVYRVAKQVTQEVGDVTILVNNAGVVNGRRFLDCPDELIQRTINVNAMAYFWTLRAFLPSMIAKNHGHIVSISSIMGSVSGPRLTDYCASKYATVGLHESLALELLAERVTGIHTTLVQPYQINTGLFAGVYVNLFPPLDPQYVADKTLHAVLTNQKVIILPKLMYLLPFLKSWLPFECTVSLAQGMGFLDAMDSFIGHQKQV
ncbi:epidermal retinol dehydrogenase 2-like [Ptychodera flava]|uniref:epidermal retinol dehydrogenase 2-like n=1 Tax=Ptychodera flava TaxID=63121 RepID=UPI00396A87CB